jgi:hypothetical protein
MNRLLLRNYISEYEKKFNDISWREIYKWRAVKQFQDNWNPDADDFPAMLTLSLSKTYNLMDAGNYWPRRMILGIAEKQPESVKNAFLALFDEENDALERIECFQKDIDRLSIRLFPGKKSYQDYRAVLVYLNLKYPEVYFFYKYGMFKVFCEKVECDFVPRMGKSSVVQYLELCKTIREEIRSNNNLLKLHKGRIGDSEYFDAESNILTQDFIYATKEYLDLGEKPVPTLKPNLTLTTIPFEPSTKTYLLKGSFSDYVARQKRNKVIGDQGEEFVLQYERDRCQPKYKNKIVPSSKQEGDGLGYDILSFDDNGHKKYIEVKTTTGGVGRSFFITGAELERSKKEGNNYYLYRLYNFDAKKMTANFLVLRGDLSGYCINAVEFEVIPKELKIEKE